MTLVAVDSIFAVVYVKDVYLAPFIFFGAGEGLVFMACENGICRIVPFKMASSLCWIYDLPMTYFYFAQHWTKHAFCWMSTSRLDIKPEENENFNNSNPTAATVTNTWWGDSGCFGPCFYTQMARVFAPCWRLPRCRH